MFEWRELQGCVTRVAKSVELGRTVNVTLIVFREGLKEWSCGVWWLIGV